MLEALALMAFKADDEELKTQLEGLFGELLSKSNKNIPALIELAYALDLRSLKKRIEELATSGPNDYDASRASFGGEERQVNERFHMARCISALWNEKDSLTQARLLLLYSEPSRICHSRFRSGIKHKSIQVKLAGLKKTLSNDQWQSLKGLGEMWYEFEGK